MNSEKERAFQLSMFDIRQTCAGSRLDSQILYKHFNMVHVGPQIVFSEINNFKTFNWHGVFSMWIILSFFGDLLHTGNEFEGQVFWGDLLAKN